MVKFFIIISAIIIVSIGTIIYSYIFDKRNGVSKSYDVSSDKLESLEYQKFLRDMERYTKQRIVHICKVITKDDMFRGISILSSNGGPNPCDTEISEMHNFYSYDITFGKIDLYE